jgi:BlaI family transcriptional regulator, penicillinase repressor
MLTPLELDIMKAVWRHPPVTVRDVQAQIRPTRNLAYTTVMTIMDRLHNKGFLTRQLRARTHLYSPAIAYGDVRDKAVKTLINSFFDGSETGLLQFLSGIAAAEAVARPPEFSEPPSNLDETLL